MRDRMIAATAADGSVALVAAITTNLVADARARHRLSPTATAAVGRLITAASLFGPGLKGRERLSLQIKCDGPLLGMVADVVTLPDHTIGARANAREPGADLPLRPDGRLDVGGLVGSGKLQVTKSYEVGQPYNGIVDLVSGEIAGDVAHYLANSQQIPSVVALGEVVETGAVRAGGVIAQILPGADDSTIGRLEANANSMEPLTSQLARGADPEAIVAALCGGLETRTLREYDVIFACQCTREKVETALLSLGRDELVKIASERPETEATCEFCKRSYVLSAAEVNDLAARMKGG